MKTIANEISNLGALIEKLARMREIEVQTKAQISETFGNFETNFLGKTDHDAPIFLNDSNKEL